MKTAREEAHAYLRWAANVLACSAELTGYEHNPHCDRLTAAIEARDEYWRDQIAAITAEDAGRAELWNRLDGVAKGLLDSNERIEAANLRAERDAFKAAIEVARVALEAAGKTYQDGGRGECCWECRRELKPPAPWRPCEPECVGGIARAALSRISTLVDPPGGKR